ncbi:MAG: bifunctional N(6)-L-threonylcarbamoyladenine synthase/serine/threonine protein kinase [Candidatus Aenigmatarchaeota archaeon]|nr:MAG: bifunctional N(6)-L-threonylcarbamoyladenine synthase/serine/threonine protein kinase [Candidatus Aenigmarchaeota archaeon]
MLCLGIESTAHSFGIGIVDEKCNVLANVTDMYKPPEGWGIHPTEAAKHHDEVRQDAIAAALEEAGKSMDDIGLVAFSQGPGLAPCLHKGLNTAKELSDSGSIPMIGVNHCIAHIEIGRKTTSLKDPITLYTSGANTQVLGFVSGRYRCFGETMDIGIGNALDKFGRGVGMGFPAGPRIEQIAKKGKYVELPYVVKGMDLSFSGIVTAALNKLKREKLEDVCFSLQETTFAMLTEVTERALAHTCKDEVLLTGGVAANKKLQDMLGVMCKERGAGFAAVERSLSSDNGAMIAWLGMLMHKAGNSTHDEVLPRQRTDEVDVNWI